MLDFIYRPSILESGDINAELSGSTPVSGIPNFKKIGSVVSEKS